MGDLLRLPEVASAHGADLDRVTYLIHGLMALLFVGWGVFLIYVLVRFRSSRQPKANPRGLQTRAGYWLEGLVATSEALLLVGLAIPLWSARVDDFPPLASATQVRVIAEQFAWNVHYPGPDGIFGRTAIDLLDAASNPIGLDPEDPHGKDDFTTFNRLSLPVDRPAIISLTSKDVIHSFMLNEMRIKQDTIPGIVTPVWFTPTMTTAELRAKHGRDDLNFEIACAQLCGLGHYRMRGYLDILPQAEFDTWMDEQLARKREEEASGDSFWN
ncbi:MAG: hypothetical protein AAF604_20075 [Acidobacteriota bacterium]